MRTPPLKYILCSIGVLIGGLYLPSFFTLSITHSLNYRIFLLHNSINNSNNINIKKGSYILFHIPSKKLPLVKRVGCNGGDILECENDRCYCNGILITTALKEDSEGNLLNRFEFNGTIPKDSFFAVGDHKRSYDSRYFGLIKREAVFAKAYPIF